MPELVFWLDDGVATGAGHGPISGRAARAAETHPRHEPDGVVEAHPGADWRHGWHPAENDRVKTKHIPKHAHPYKNNRNIEDFNKILNGLVQAHPRADWRHNRHTTENDREKNKHIPQTPRTHARTLSLSLSLSAQGVQPPTVSYFLGFLLLFPTFPQNSYFLALEGKISYF